ncbi:MAG: hypothetical protein ACR2RB_12870 [Gammaproteobacteria bacterium]
MIIRTSISQTLQPTGVEVAAGIYFERLLLIGTEHQDRQDAINAANRLLDDESVIFPADVRAEGMIQAERRLQNPSAQAA